MAKPHNRGPKTPTPRPDDEVVTSAHPPLKETPTADDALPEPAAAETTSAQITVCCADQGSGLCSADNTPHPTKKAGTWTLPRPKAATLYWVTALHRKRRQLVLHPDSPDELHVSLKRVTRRAGAVQAPATADAKALAKKHADEVEAAIAGAETLRGTPGFRKSPKAEAPDIQLSARQYIRARGYRWEQCAGFLHDMKAKFGAGAAKVRPEWAKLWDAYQTRPVK